MATTTKRRPAVSREALAESATEVREEAPTTTAEAIAAELAPLFNDINANFDRCRVAYAGVSAGIKGDDIAKATTKALAHTMHPNNAKLRAWAESTSVAQGGAAVSRAAIVQRSSAWSDLIEAGISAPTPDSVAAAYKLTTTGNSGETRKAIVEAVAKMPAAKREVSYITRAEKALVELRRANRARSAEKAAGDSADAKAEAPGADADVSKLSAVEVVSFLRAVGQRQWDRAESDLISEALADLSARILAD